MNILINKKSKLVCLATAVLMTSGILFSTGINAHADEVVANTTQVQTTLSDIEADNNTVYDGEHLIQERSCSWKGAGNSATSGAVGGAIGGALGGSVAVPVIGSVPGWVAGGALGGLGGAASYGATCWWN